MNIERTKDGYLKNFQEWNTQIAEHIAKEQEIELTDNHWEILNLVREFYTQYQTSPSIRALVNAIKIKYGAEKGNSIYVHRLFPGGAASQATLLAGVPKPIRCI